MAGVTADAMALEIKKAFSQRLRREKKKQERKDLTPSIQLQPSSRALRYENIRSARAEEGVLRLVSLDPSLAGSTEGLRSEEFSSPLLGKVFDLFSQQTQQGLSPSLAALAGQLTGEEMDHLSHIITQPESLANGRQALQDYIAIIRGEALRRDTDDADALLRAAQQRHQIKKSYMEEKP